MPLKANEDLIKLFHLAVESGDVKLINEVIEALLKMEDNNKNVVDALSRYNDRGYIDFALHNAIKDKNLLASVILTHYSKNVNARTQICHTPVMMDANNGLGSFETPLELALENDMIELIPYLIMKKADPYLIRDIMYIYEDEKYPDNTIELLMARGLKVERKVCVKSERPFFVSYQYQYEKKKNRAFIGQRTFIGDVIAKNRLDVMQILQRTSVIDWNRECFIVMNAKYTPLQFALATKRYEIAQFLLDHGARIE